VTFSVGADERRYWSAATRDWTLDAAEFEVFVGPDATAERSATFRVR
jgi:beta-glucosidase